MIILWEKKRFPRYSYDGSLAPTMFYLFCLLVINLLLIIRAMTTILERRVVIFTFKERIVMLGYSVIGLDKY